MKKKELFLISRKKFSRHLLINSNFNQSHRKELNGGQKWEVDTNLRGVEHVNKVSVQLKKTDNESLVSSNHFLLKFSKKLIFSEFTDFNLNLKIHFSLNYEFLYLFLMTLIFICNFL